ncbi:antitoxin [Luteimicrobium subarcticum]|uniref:Ribbon-helix-helix CopG family protein n=1 Tax=Luteimicrobium subarcticum TaxID=620910 RepID=A0A2M8WSN0_9MICO|nr:antitoxin [Luteimicrobium subarcticum]PJI93929.1 hypothetical protein CLV34_1410 [Luteimicrobium subarcticum]
MTKLSISLEDRDVAVLDTYVARHPGLNRSAALREAIDLLRERELATQYDAAYAEWSAAGSDDVWDVTASDGLA